MIRVVRIDYEDSELRVVPDPGAFAPVGRRVDQNMVAIVIKPHRRQAHSSVWPDQTKGYSNRAN